MEPGIIFSVASLLAMFGWVLLLVSPWIPVWSDRLAGAVLPALISMMYFGIAVLFPAESGGFGSLAQVAELFSHSWTLAAGWLHYLAFDLVIGAWQCRTARERGIGFGWVLPCLPFTFLVGPIGFLMFLAVLGWKADVAGESVG